MDAAKLEKDGPATFDLSMWLARPAQWCLGNCWISGDFKLALRDLSSLTYAV